jgi:hypothetical protein
VAHPPIPTPPTREALSVDTTLGDPIRQTAPELETTPTGILPITKTEQTSKANRKVTFLDPQKMSYQDIFDETYSLELENLLSSGLSHKLAVSTALALAQTAVQELFTPTPAIPARSKSKSEFYTCTLVYATGRTSSHGGISRFGIHYPIAATTCKTPPVSRSVARKD